MPRACAAEYGYDAIEMAATLRDMLWFPRALDSLRTRLFVSTKEIRSALSPQSAWGNKLVSDLVAARQATLDKVTEDLMRYGDLEAALSPAGFRMPVLNRYFRERPEYLAVDRLLFGFSETSNCDQDAEQPNCYLILKLQKDAAGSISVRAITLEHPNE